jgi:hypothetical protein
MKNHRKVVAFAITAILTLTFLCAIGIKPAQAATVMKVVPASTTAVLNNNYTIFINVTDVTDLYAWEFQLDYDPTILDLNYNGTVSGGLNTPTVTYFDDTNEATGHLWWSVSTTFPTTNGIGYADHAIFEMQFEAIATGTSHLNLSGTILVDNSTNPISHTVTNGSITVYQRDLTVSNIFVLSGNRTQDCSIYQNDTYPDGATPWYYAVEVDVTNTGTLAAGAFNVTLEIYNGTHTEATGEMTVASLAADTTTTVNFTSLFHPMYTSDYTLTATADVDDNVTEDNEANNVLALSNVQVTLKGDINGDKTVNILDAVVISLAWGATKASGHWNVAADINHSGSVDISDAVRIGAHWGESW